VAGEFKADTRWKKAIWLGKVESSDEHICGVADRVDKYRVVRRCPESERWDSTLFEAMRATPWGENEQMADATSTTKRRYLTQKLIEECGPTPGCGKCDGTSATHTPRCRERMEKILKEKEEKELAERRPVTPPVSQGEPKDDLLPAGEQPAEVQAEAAEAAEEEEAAAPAVSAGEPRGKKRRSVTFEETAEEFDQEEMLEESAPEEGVNSSSSSGSTADDGVVLQAAPAAAAGSTTSVHRRLWNKRKVPWLPEPGVPESSRVRTLQGTEELMHICQEEEMPVAANSTFHVFSLLVEHGFEEQMASEIAAISQEKVTLTEQPKKYSCWPPPIDEFEFQLGACEGVECVRTGTSLPSEDVKKARSRELKEVKIFKVWEYVPREEAAGKKKVRRKWVDELRKGAVKCRLVAMEVAYQLRSDTHAGTPPLAIVRFLISCAATGPPTWLMVHDVTCAFLHASMDGENEIYVELPAGLAPPGCVGRLLAAMYGTRRASFLWGEHICTKMTSPKAGFIRLVGCAQMYYHPKRRLKVVVHGDDFLSEGEKQQLWWFDKFLRAEFKVKFGTMIGPGEEYDVTFLIRSLAYVPEIGYTYSPDEKHINICVEKLGLEAAKPVKAPGVEDHGGVLSTGQDKLGKVDSGVFVSCTGSLIYLALDRYDIQYAVRCLAQVLSSPCVLDMLILKHLVKCLIGTRTWLWVFHFQEMPKLLDAGSDSDWAQDPVTRKSVSSGFLRWGKHIWEHWCSGQQLVALSSGEAEFYAGGKAAAHALFFVFLLAELGQKIRARVVMDSSAARGIFSRSGPAAPAPRT
jgi:hypothetical protein